MKDAIFETKVTKVIEDNSVYEIYSELYDALETMKLNVERMKNGDA